MKKPLAITARPMIAFRPPSMITMKRKKGNLNLKFDASESQYLEILIKYGIRFNEADMISTLKIYDKYAKRLDKKTAEQSKSAIG